MPKGFVVIVDNSRFLSSHVTLSYKFQQIPVRGACLSTCIGFLGTSFIQDSGLQFTVNATQISNVWL